MQILKLKDNLVAYVRYSGDIDVRQLPPTPKSKKTLRASKVLVIEEPKPHHNKAEIYSKLGFDNDGEMTISVDSLPRVDIDLFAAVSILKKTLGIRKAKRITKRMIGF